VPRGVSLLTLSRPSYGSYTSPTGATSFTDDNFGAVITAAQTASLYDETIVIFLGDHGFQLGDNDQWSKVTNFEHATRIPFMVCFVFFVCVLLILMDSCAVFLLLNAIQQTLNILQYHTFFFG
jgi:membrane-anchored protein YejM (alkaline phosphatase superfamily)